MLIEPDRVISLASPIRRSQAIELRARIFHVDDDAEAGGAAEDRAEAVEAERDAVVRVARRS